MTVLPAHVSRTSNMLASQLSLGNINRTNVRLLDVQTQLATGRAVNRPSDSPIKAAAIAALDRRLEQSNQRALNLNHAASVVNTLDSALGEARDLVDRASTIASAQIGINSDAATRAGQATVVDSLVQTLFNLANRDAAGVYLFGGATPGTPPVVQQAGGYRYVARGDGLYTDLGLGDSIPITIGGDNAVGETSARLRSAADLNPNLHAANKLANLRGARSVGIAPGLVSFQFGASPVATADLTATQSVGDAVTRLTAAIRQYETDNGVTILGPGGVSTSGGALSIDVVAGGTLTFSDPTGSTTASDLGLTQATFTPADPTGVDLNPRVTLETRLADLPGVTVPLDSIRLRVASGVGGVSQFRDVSLAGATTLDDVRNLIEASGLGVRVQVNSAGTGIDVVNEVAGRAMSIEEVAGGANTATQLGIRSLAVTTAIADFNGGRGVRIVDGAVDPVSGAVDPARNVDFRVTLGNGQQFDVDLRPQDLATVQTVLDRINAQFTSAIGQPPVVASAPVLLAGDFQATLTGAGNGIAFVQAATVTPGPLTVAGRNNSAAADDLGLRTGVYDGASMTLLAQDRATVRVDNLFSDLIDLRDALLANDSAGITLAGERLTASGERLTQAHALVGSYSQRIQETSERLEDVQLIDTTSKSQLQDLDYTEASVLFSLLQTQLQASLQTAGRFQNQSLLDFLR